MIYLSFFILLAFLQFPFSSYASSLINPEKPNTSEVQNLLQDLARRARLADFSNPELIDYLKVLVRMGHDYDVSCDSSMFSGISEWNCIVGLQTLVTALDRRQIIANPELLGIEEITLGPTGSWKTIKKSWHTISLQIPFNATPADMARYVHFTLLEPRRRNRRGLLENAEAMIQRINDQTRLRVNIADEVTPEEMLRTLRIIDTVKDHYMSIIRRENVDQLPIATITLDNKSVIVFPRGYDLSFNVNVQSQNRQIEEFFVNQLDMIDPSAGDRMSGIPRERWAIVQEFRAARKDLYDTLTQVRERIPHLDIHCGNNDSLWLRRCVDGLKSFYYALHEVPASTTLTIDKLVIVEHMWDSSHVEFRTETVKKKTFNILEFSFRITPSPLARKILDSQTTVSQHTKNDLRSPVQLLGDRR